MAEEKNKNNENENQEDLGDDYVIAWEGPEYIKHSKTRKWYFLAGIIVLLLIIWALLQNSAPMAIALFIAAGVYYLYESQHPKNVQIAISEMGIRIGDIFYPYTSLRSFYVEYHPPIRRLHIIKSGSTRLRIELDFPEDLDPSQLREYLLTQLPEENEEEQNFLDKFFRFIKF